MDEDVKKASIKVHDGKGLRIKANRNKIIQVLLNLVRNSAQAVDEGVSGKIDLEIEKEGNFAVLKVRDNGRGIPPDKLEKIWEPFFTTKGESGTGIGLDISRQIVTRHGGFISCTSEPGRGTVFVIKLPLAAEK